MMATSLNYNRKRQRLLSNCSSNSNNARPNLLLKKQHYSNSINNEIINLDSDDDDYIFNNNNNNNNNNNQFENNEDLDLDFDLVMNDDDIDDDIDNNLSLHTNDNLSIDSNDHFINNTNNNINNLGYNLNYNFNNSESAVEDSTDDNEEIREENEEEEEEEEEEGYTANDYGDDDYNYSDNNNNNNNNNNLDNGQSYAEYFEKNHSKYATRHLSFTSPINNFVNRFFKKSNNLSNSNQVSLSSSSLNSINNKKKRTKSLPQLSYAKLTYSPSLDLNEVNLKIGDVKASLINHRQNLNYTYNNYNNNYNNNNRNFKNLRKFSFNQNINHKSSTSSNPSFSSTSKSSATSSYDDKYLSNSKNDSQYIYNGNNNNNTDNDNDNQIEEINCDDDDGHYIVKNGAPFANGRFIIKKLLGQGTFGKVVKAYDNKTNSFVAIKIIKSIHKYREASKIELRVLTMLKKHDPLNKFQCIHLRECFDYRNHICIVTDLLKISIYDFMDKNQFLPFPGSHIQAIAKQLLRSVAFLHDLNLIHTDLKPENILIKDSSYCKKPFKKLNNNNDDDDDKIYLRKILKDPKIYTIDFGSAIFQDEYHSSIISTRHYRAPEIILGIGWSFPCDIWSIGCVLIELLTGDALFKTHDNEQHLAMMEKVINKPIDLKIVRQCLLLYKSNFKNNSINNNNRFDATIVNSFSKKTGKLKFPISSTDKKLIQEVEQLNSIEKIVEEKIGFKFDLNMTVKDSISFFKINSKQRDDYIFWYYYIDLIKKMLVFDPNKRITAKNSLNHKWFSLGILDDGI